MKLGAQAQQAAEQKDLCFHRYVPFSGAAADQRIAFAWLQLVKTTLQGAPLHSCIAARWASPNVGLLAMPKWVLLSAKATQPLE
jgi:hypothetical protein